MFRSAVLCVLALCFGHSAAFAQTLPSPTFATLTVNAGASMGDLTQKTTGTWRMNFHDSGSSLLIKDFSGNNLLQINPTNVNFPKTITWASPPAFSGAYSISTQTATFQNGVFTGSVTGNPAIYANFLQNASAITGANSFVGLGINAFMNTGMTGNIYTIDAQASTSGVPATTGQEIHAARFTTTLSQNMNGSGGSLSGVGIGIKAAIGITAAATFTSLNTAIETVFNNSSASAGSNYGQWIEDASIAQGTLDHVGLTIVSDSGSVGWKRLLSFGAYGRGSGPCGSLVASCTLIYGQGALGAAFTAQNGIDWHLGTFTGNTWNDGHLTIDGNGNLATSGTLAGASATVGNITENNTGNWTFKLGGASSQFLFKTSDGVTNILIAEGSTGDVTVNHNLIGGNNISAAGTLTVTGGSFLANVSQGSAGNWSFIAGNASTIMLWKNSAAANVMQLDTSANTLTVAGAAFATRLSATSGNVILGSGSAVATSATAGMVAMPTTAGAPTGTVGAAGQAAFVIDTTNKKLCYSTGGGTWECSAAFTP